VSDESCKTKTAATATTKATTTAATAVMSTLLLKRALASLPFEWHGEDYDVLQDGVVVGRIFTSLVAPKDTPWFWSLAHAHVLNRRPTSGTAATRDEALYS
jgi:hypothetical protein